MACENDITPPNPQPPQGTLDQQLRASLRQWGIVPIGPMPAQNSALVELGQALFFDKVLSGNRDVSCATCHEPSLTVGDAIPLSVGTGGTGGAPNRTLGAGREFVPRNSPGLLNVGLGQNYIFWDGRVQEMGTRQFQTPAGAALPSGLPNVLAAQAMFPVTNRDEMRGKPGDKDVFGNPNELAAFGDSQFTQIWYAVTQRLLGIPEYVTLFTRAFPTTPTYQFTFAHAAIALAAFQRGTMIRTRTPFDRYLEREDAALTTEQKRGALLFFGDGGCSSCHNGPFLGGNQFANVGVPQIGPGTGAAAPLDKGFGPLLGTPFYDFAFRVAPLRNVELTAPYMHNGAYATLEAVLKHYSDVPTAQQNYDVNQLPLALRGMHHGDQATIAAVLLNLDTRVPEPGSLDDTEQRELVAFLRALTDPAARNLQSLAPSRVPSGLPISN
jgi:cytochrome c peroxidase